MSISALRNQNSFGQMTYQTSPSLSFDNNCPVNHTLMNISKTTRIADGNGMAIILSLSLSVNEEMPCLLPLSPHVAVSLSNGILRIAQYYLNQKDPVSEYNTQLWNSGVESDKEITRKI